MKRLLLLLLMVSTIECFADEYIDPATNVIYTYKPGQSTASVKEGYEPVSSTGGDSDSYQNNPDVAGDVAILDKFTVGTEEYIVTSIGNYAFCMNANIKSVSIPETVTNIGVAAFECCDGLTAVQLPEGLTRISRALFFDCRKLQSVAIPSSVRAIDEQAFDNCLSLASLTLPAGLNYIGRYAFRGTPWYSTQYNEAPNGLFYIGPLLVGYKGDAPTGELVIKEGTTCIGYQAFNYCTSLTSVTIPESLTHIDYRAFYNCVGLTAVHITDLAAWCGIEFQWDDVSSSSNPLFYAHHLYLNGEEVTDPVIPDGATSIGQYAFDNCTGLTSVTIPDGVTRICSKAFRNCSNLTSVTIPPSVAIIESLSFLWCNNLTAVHISDLAAWCGISFQAASDVFNHGARLYLNGEEVSDLVIPDGVASIGSWSFMNCSQLTSVTIPESVTKIGENAFFGCKNLTDVYCHAKNVPSTGYGVFYSTPIASVTLHVPAGSLEMYKTTEPWSEFGNIVALAEEIAQKYFPEGTRWTEIRLDTLKYDSWYSKIGDEWVPNFETIEYRVQGEYTYRDRIYKKVYSNGPEWTDSLTLLISEDLSDNTVYVTVPVFEEDAWRTYLPSPSEAYQFDWSLGTELYYQEIVEASATCYPPCGMYYYGVIKEINEGDFGGVRPLKYVDLDGKAPVNTEKPWIGNSNGGRIIQGIGITEWNGGECLFGPPNPYWAFSCFDTYSWDKYPDRHYRSKLVHFERNGEVLYNVWPEKETAESVTFTKDQMATIILPTAPDASKGKYYKLDKCEDNQIVFEQETQPQARTPYIIVPNEDFSIDMSTLDVAGLSPDTVTVGGISFIGSYVRTELPALTGGDGGGSSSSSYYDIIDQTPDCQGAASSTEMSIVGALRAYLVVTWDDPIDYGGTRSPQEKMELVLLDEGDSISRPTPDPSRNGGEVYDLSGRRVGNGKWIMEHPRLQSRLGAKASKNGQLKPGIYIVGGKKILVK